MYNPFSLLQKTVFVTGASSGIGRAVAIECSKMGASLIITGRDKGNLNETFLRLEGTNHFQILADLRDDLQVTSLIKQLPALDGVVHCAGIVKTLPFQFVTKEKLDEIFSINFFSPTMITQQLLKGKKINKNASIVWISSIAGPYIASPGKSMYGATKGAVNGIVKGMAVDLANREIRVNSVCPGMIETRIMTDGQITEEQIEADKLKYPLKRYGKPEEVAYAVIYLLSDASAWVTGSNIVIDGGVTIL